MKWGLQAKRAAREPLQHQINRTPCWGGWGGASLVASPALFFFDVRVGGCY